MDEDIMLSKFIEINERSKQYVELMSTYPSMVKSIHQQYDDLIALRRSQLDEFKMTAAKALSERCPTSDYAQNKKISDNIRKIGLTVNEIVDAAKELSNVKKIIKQH